MKTSSGSTALHSTRAQVKMFETIGVLVVFIVLLAGGGAFYFKMQESALQQELAKARQLRLLQSSLKATFLPELDCSFVGVQRENCIDFLKAEAFAGLSEEHAQYYFGLFGTSTVKLTSIYPDPSINVLLYNNPLEEYHSKIPARTPVLVYDPAQKTYAFGVLEVTSYAK